MREAIRRLQSLMTSDCHPTHRPSSGCHPGSMGRCHPPVSSPGVIPRCHPGVIPDPRTDGLSARIALPVHCPADKRSDLNLAPHKPITQPIVLVQKAPSLMPHPYMPPPPIPLLPPPLIPTAYPPSVPERLGELGVVDLAIARRVEMVHQKHQRAVIEGHLMRKAIRRHQ